MYYLKGNIQKKTGKIYILYPREDYDSRKVLNGKYNFLKLTYTNYFKAFSLLLYWKIIKSYSLLNFNLLKW